MRSEVLEANRGPVKCNKRGDTPLRSLESLLRWESEMNVAASLLGGSHSHGVLEVCLLLRVDEPSRIAVLL